MKFAICNELFEGWDFAEVCKFVTSVGYEGLEIAPFTLAEAPVGLSPTRRRDLRQQASDAGISIIGLHWLLAGTDGMHLTSPDSVARDRLSDYLVTLAGLCHDLGGKVMVFGSPKQRSVATTVNDTEAFDWAASTFRKALPAIADLGVVICMEPLSPVETNFITTVDQAVRLIDAVDHPNFGLHLDVKAMSSEPTPVPDLVRRHAGRARHFHANDANLRGPGFGETDFVPIFQALHEGGYDGWVSVEVFDFTPDAKTVAQSSIDYMRTCLPVSAPLT